ncbi:MAG: DNA-binding protein [Prevotella sp.]|nr:DNA-binding protein [Prevotella sp.]
MALNIRLLKNNIKSNPNYGKYFGRVIHYGEVTIDDFAEEIQHNCSATKSDVQLVITELQATIKRHLQEGHIVVLPEIGRLKLSVETVGVDKPKDFNLAKHLKRVVCRFLPAGTRGHQRNGSITYNLCEGTKVTKVVK